MVISLGAYLTILAALAAERVFHLALAARNARRAFARARSSTGRATTRRWPRSTPSSCSRPRPRQSCFKRPFPGTLGWTALGGALGAQALRYWSVASLGSRWNTRIIVFPGMPPVKRGPYRFMRHPNYLAVIVEIACVPLIRGCWMTAVVFSIGNAVLLRVRIRAEEAAMGPRYASSSQAGCG